MVQKCLFLLTPRKISLRHYIAPIVCPNKSSSSCSLAGECSVKVNSEDIRLRVIDVMLVSISLNLNIKPQRDISYDSLSTNS